MDIALMLLPGDKRTVGGVEDVVSYLSEHTEAVGDVLRCLECGNEALAMRAADALQKLYARCPEAVTPLTGRLFDLLVRCEQKEVRWHLSQMLPLLPLSRAQAQTAFEAWRRDLAESSSSIVRACALEAMYHASDRRHELKTEFLQLLGEALTSGAPAVKARARKLSREIARASRPAR